MSSRFTMLAAVGIAAAGLSGAFTGCTSGIGGIGGGGGSLGLTGMTIDSHEQYYRHYKKEGLPLKHTAEQLAAEFKDEFDKGSYPVAHRKAKDGYIQLQPYFEEWVEAVVAGKPDRVAVAADELEAEIQMYGETLKDPTGTGGTRGAWLAVVAGLMQNQSTIVVVNKVGDWWKTRSDQLSALETDFEDSMGLESWDAL